MAQPKHGEPGHECYQDQSFSISVTGRDILIIRDALEILGMSLTASAMLAGDPQTVDDFDNNMRMLGETTIKWEGFVDMTHLSDLKNRRVDDLIAEEWMGSSRPT